MSSPDPDLSVWQDLREGYDAALDILMERHSEGLFRFIYRYVLNERDARDLVQETFVRAYFKQNQFLPRARVSTWLYRIALNLCRDHARSRAFKEARLTDTWATSFEQQALTRTTPADHASTEEDLALLQKAIQSLPHDLRVALILAVLEDKPQEECAQLLGITRKAVETRVYRARKLLAERLPNDPDKTARPC
jgi:RNA polymerase sigma factor (sigma-70 family)